MGAMAWRWIREGLRGSLRAHSRDGLRHETVRERRQTKTRRGPLAGIRLPNSKVPLAERPYGR